MNSAIIRRINQDLGVSVSRVEAVVRLLEDGATVPFIARYRKEATGNLDEVRIRDIADRHTYYEALEVRRQTVLRTIEKQGQLQEALRKRIENCYSKSELEDLYLPYRPRRHTRADEARQRGLEPLADFIEQQSETAPPEEIALRFVDPTKKVPTPDAALDGAVDILATRIAENADLRQWLRKMMLERGVVRASRAGSDRKAAATKYAMYSDFEEPVSRIPSHRMLAVRRGTREKALRHAVVVDHAQALAELTSRLSIQTDTAWGQLFVKGATDAYRRLLEPSIQTETRSFLKAKADGDAIKVFQENLRAKLLAPPAGYVPVMGIDPGLKTGSKIAVIDSTGKLLDHLTIYLVGPKKDFDGAEESTVDLIRKHRVGGIAIGNGTGSRETEGFIRPLVEKHGLDVFTVVTNEAGASVYSASRRARQEFPKLDVTMRGAVSIARRLQDPLAELVKIDPGSMGVGQYQHDVDQKKLRNGLDAAVESAVNQVGVDLNTASADLLKYISGVSSQLARSIVEYRNTHGPFSNRQQLLNVPGFGEKTFEQAAGFLRIKEGTNPLDRTAVHPESYDAVRKMAASLGIEVADLVEDSSRVNAIEFQSFEQELGRYTAADIRNELLKPGRDPRVSFRVPHFRDDVREFGDLAEGMELDGIVTNVTNFGAFVDLGIHQDGLIHISELSHRYIADAKQTLHIGDLVKVTVIGIDAEKKRISLSRKARLPKPQPPRRPEPRPGAKPAAQLEVRETGKSKRRTPRPKTRETTVAPKKKAVRVEAEMSYEEKIRRLREKFRGPER